MDLLHILAFNLLLNLFFSQPALQKTKPPPLRHVQAIKVEAQQRVQIPEWVTNIPKNCFVGISRPCQSIEEARQEALHSAVSLILQAMGAEYSLKHRSVFFVRNHQSQHELRERLAYTTKWFLRSVQQNIKKSDIRKINGGYICFVLIDYPEVMIKKVRRLTIGPKVAARIIEKADDHLFIKVTENNGVQADLTNYEIEITTKNRHADIITMFAWKVSESSSKNFRGILRQKISVKNNSKTFEISAPNQTLNTNLKSLLLGSENNIKIVLSGYDEIGRPLSLNVSNQ